MIFFAEGSLCPKGGEHQVKFNGGNPLCLKCGGYLEGPPRVTLPAVLHDEQFHVTSPFPPATCGRCGKPAAGFATINGQRFCHGDFDPTPTCYSRASFDLAFPPAETDEP